MISLGVSGITAALLFRIDEVVTVTGKLESLSGSVKVKDTCWRENCISFI